MPFTCVWLNKWRDDSPEKRKQNKTNNNSKIECCNSKSFWCYHSHTKRWKSISPKRSVIWNLKYEIFVMRDESTYNTYINIYLHFSRTFNVIIYFVFWLWVVSCECVPSRIHIRVRSFFFRSFSLNVSYGVRSTVVAKHSSQSSQLDFVRLFNLQRLCV